MNKRRTDTTLPVAHGAFGLTSLTPWLQLVKAPLCLSVAFSAGFGYLLYLPEFTMALAGIILGVFLLACSAAGLNSLQEVKADGQHLRTMNRPLVTGRLTPRAAVVCTSILFASGLLVLSLVTMPLPPVLGVLTFAIYNGIYTPLKKRSVFALLAGGISGALPPLIGWSGAGGQLFDLTIVAVFILFFLWQIPHYCMVLLSNQKDSLADTRPNLLTLLPEKSVKKIAFVWIAAYGCAVLFFTIAQVFTSDLVRLVVAGTTLITIGIFSGQLLFTAEPNYKRLFISFNLLFFATLMLIAFENL